MRHQFESEGEPILSDEELIDRIWEEKRDKAMGDPPTEALYIGITSPEIHIDAIADGLIETLLSLPPQKAFDWSRNWGRTKVVLSFNEPHFGFLDDESREAKKSVKLLTDKLVSPQLCIDAKPQDKKFFIVLNDEPSPVEGVVLQAERMVDELVWCLGLKYREQIDDPVMAYRAALEDVAQNGFDFYTLNKQQLLDLRREDDSYQVRLYGNKNSRGKVPQIIGAVGPLSSHTRPISKQHVAKTAATIEPQPQVEELTLPDKPFINMGICVAKRPHIGHMLLAGVVEIARRSIDDHTLGEIPIVIHANDTGPRIAQTLARASDQLGISQLDVIEAITNGRIDSSQLDLFYRTREQAEKSSVVKAEQTLKGHPVSLLRQAQEHIESFSNFWGTVGQIEPESMVDSTLFGPQDVLNDPTWHGTGLSFTKIGNKRYMLESDGFLTASAARSTTLNSSSQRLNRGMPIYIDGDRSITDAFEILKAQTGIQGIQFQGAAIGFNMQIQSGSKGDVMPMDDFIGHFHKEYPNRSLLEDTVYLLNTRYQLKPANGLAFFDYADHEAFVNDLDKANLERTELAEKLRRTARILEAAISQTDTDDGNTKKDKEARWLEHHIELLLNDFGHERKQLEHIFLQPQLIRETPQVQRLIDRLALTEKISIRTAETRVLTAIATGQITVSSNIVDEFKKHGYAADGLVVALSEYVKGNFTFTRINNLLFQRLSAIERLLDHAPTFDGHTCEALLNAYRVSCAKLFRIDI